MQGFGKNLALKEKGVELQVFEREAPENGAEGAVLENFKILSAESGEIALNCLKWLRNAIKRKNRGIYRVFCRRRRRKTPYAPLFWILWHF